MRTKAILNALWYGIMPSWVYEDSPHYAPDWGYRQHLQANLCVAWRWLTWREDEDDREFERLVNA
jgi:hypothetical protein